MADIIKIDADTSGAIAALQRLQTKLEETQNKFEKTFSKMTQAAAALGASLIAAGVGVAAFADDVSDLADANQLAIGEILALGQALGQSGGKAENTGKLLQTLANKVDEANSGNIKLAGTFGRLGISISDLGNLSNTELRDKLLDNIARIEDPMMRNAKAVEIFGKSMIGVDVRKFAEAQKASREEMEKFAGPIKTAGEAFDQMAAILERLKIAFAVAFEPFFALVTQINPSIDGLVLVFRVLGAALAGLSLVAIVAGFNALRVAIIGVTIAAAANPIMALATGALAVATYFGLGAASANKLADSTNKVGEAAKKSTREQTGLNDAIQKERDKISKVGEELQKNFDIALRKYQQETLNLGLSEDQRTVAEAISKIEDDRINARAKAEDAYKQQSADVQALTKATLDAELAGIDLKAAKQKTATEAELASLSDRKRAVEDFNKALGVQTSGVLSVASAEAKASIDLIGNINDRIAAEGRFNEVLQIRAAISSQISKLGDTDKLSVTQALDEATIKTAGLVGTTDNLGLSFTEIFSNLATGYKTSAAGLDIVTSSLAQQKGAIGSTADLIINSQQQISENSRMFSTGWTKAFNDYVNNATNAATQAGAIFNKFSSGLEDYFINRLKGINGGWKDFLKGLYEEIARSQIKQGLAKVFEGLGFGKLFGSAGGATAGASGRGSNPGTPLYTQDVMRNMGQGGMPTQETGMFDGIKTTIAEFTDSVGNFLSNMFSGLGNAIGGFTSSVGSILSSIGGTLFDVIGSIGGTLFDVIGSLGSGLGDILGSIGGGGGGGGGILSTLFDIGASLFGFANGGVIPNNGPVLVGEKGPELLFGSQGAAVVPLGGGGTNNITYNINAVDAMSFKQMIAADPTFIYAVTQQGAKGMPGRR